MTARAVLAVTRVSSSVSSAPSARAGALFLRDLRGGVADRDEHREHRRRALRLGRAHREERVQERAVQAEVAGRDEVAEVIEHRADLRARGRLVEPAERRIERRAQLEQAAARIFGRSAS